MILWMWMAWAAEPSFEPLSSADEWKKVAERNSDVGRVDVRLKRINDLPCLEGRVVVPESPESLWGVATDIPSATSWSSAGLTASEALGKGADWVDYFQYLDVPGWTLVADRFWVLRGKTLREGEDIRFRWWRESWQEVYPEAAERIATDHPKAIEPPINYGEWQFAPQEEGTLVVYRACADVGGSLPTSIQRFVASRTLPDTVADLVLEARRRDGTP